MFCVHEDLWHILIITTKQMPNNEAKWYHKRTHTMENKDSQHTDKTNARPHYFNSSSLFLCRFLTFFFCSYVKIKQKYLVLHRIPVSLTLAICLVFTRCFPWSCQVIFNIRNERINENKLYAFVLFIRCEQEKHK